jgi:hypothetical protein
MVLFISHYIRGLVFYFQQYFRYVPSQESDWSCFCVLGVSRQESDWSCICVLGVMYLCVRGIDFVTLYNLFYFNTNVNKSKSDNLLDKA